MTYIEKCCLHCKRTASEPLKVELKGVIFYFCGLAHAGSYLTGLALQPEETRDALEKKHADNHTQVR